MAQQALRTPARTLALLLGLSCVPVVQAVDPGGAGAVGKQRDGQHDFEFEIGSWETRLKRLAEPLSGSQRWIEYQGTSIVSEVLGGRANLVELQVEGADGRIDGASLRLYDPQARQWSLNYASVRNGRLTQPLYGGFRDGRGEFHGLDDVGGRTILVRFLILPQDAGTVRFEQAFSEDGGRSWETNWIAIDTRMRAREDDAR